MMMMMMERKQLNREAEWERSSGVRGKIEGGAE